MASRRPARAAGPVPPSLHGRSGSDLAALALLLDASPLAVVECDAGLTIRHWSSQAETMFGWSADEAVGQTLPQWTFVHPDDVGRVTEALGTLLSGTVPRLVVRHRNVTRDGRVLHCEWYESVLRDADGRPASVLALALDVTDRVEAETRLRENEERFRLLARATNDTVWDHDLVRDEVWRSNGFATMMGLLSPDDRSPDAWVSRIHPADRERVYASYRGAIEGTASRWSDEYRLRHADGSWRTVLDRGYILRDSDGRALRMIGGVTDVTEQRATAARVAQQAALIDESRDAILVLDAGLRVRFWSRGAEAIYGWTAAEAAGQVLPALLHQPAGTSETVRHALTACGEWSGELSHCTRDGRWLTVLSRWVTRPASDAAAATLLVLNTDVTERKALEAQFLRAQRLESLGVLAGGIAHDLNNVLAPVVMAVDLLDAHVSDASGQSLLASAKDSLQRAAAIVRQVLSFARGAGGRRTPLAAERAVRDVLHLVRETFPRNIEVRVQATSPACTVMADPTQIQQVLMNLCVNARDAMPDGGTLTIGVDAVRVDAALSRRHPEAPPGDYVVFTVSDTGSGMPVDVVQRLFEPFFSTKPVAQGTGLGLSTSLSLVRAHGGFIDVDSAVGVGSTFRVYLPSAPPGTLPDAETRDKAELPRGAGELVLVVDDEASVRAAARAALERHGYRVQVAADGAEALEVHERAAGGVALVITDMMMPRLDGSGLIAALRARDPQVRVIASSGVADEGQVVKAAALGVTRFLAKPYGAATLLREVRAVLDEPIGHG